MKNPPKTVSWFGEWRYTKGVWVETWSTGQFSVVCLWIWVRGNTSNQVNHHLPIFLLSFWNINNFFFIFYICFLIGEKLLYNVLLVSAIQQCESAVSIYVSPPSWRKPLSPLPSHPFRQSSQSIRLGSLLYAAIYTHTHTHTRWCIYVSDTTLSLNYC